MNQPCPGRVSRERRGHVHLIGLDRATKRNAFDLDLLNDLSLAYGEFEADSEARVAADIALGLDPQVIARRDGRSAHTVRAQLKAVFTKMRCNRQNQLAAMVLQSPAVKWLDS